MMGEYILYGLVLGFSAGISPGPLMALVISQTLRHSFIEGVKIAVAPILTDLPIVLLSTFVLLSWAQTNTILGIISLAGGVFLCWLAWETASQKKVQMNLDHVAPRSYLRGMVTNFLSPHPYLFWITVGSPLIVKGYQENLLNPVLFLVSFYLLIVGSKIGVAYIVTRSKDFLMGGFYQLVMKILGVILFIFALIFFKDGIQLISG